MVWACIIRAAMQDNFSLPMPVEDRKINHGVFTKVIWFHLGQRYSSALVEMTVYCMIFQRDKLKFHLCQECALPSLGVFQLSHV